MEGRAFALAREKKDSPIRKKASHMHSRHLGLARGDSSNQDNIAICRRAGGLRLIGHINGAITSN